MIFIDGIGIGEPDPEKNPFFKRGFETFKKTFGLLPSLENSFLANKDAFLFPVDACLGIEGLPQSGTGQTSIFCGENASKIIGMHFGPYPHSGLLDTLKEKNILKAFINLGLSADFVNAYPKVFFDYIASGKKRLSATSLMSIFAGVRLKNSKDLRLGKALSAEIDNSRWIKKLYYKLPHVEPEKAAARLLKIAGKNNFTLFEYFFTDHFGHGRNMDFFNSAYNALDRFLTFIIEKIDRKETTLIICSDHGNFEDLSVKSHTRNPALTIVAGKNSQMISDEIKSLYDIKSALMNAL